MRKKVDGFFPLFSFNPPILPHSIKGNGGEGSKLDRGAIPASIFFLAVTRRHASKK
jgi:hypothetical protein